MLPQNHPFIKAIFELENLERRSGFVSDEIINIRLELKNKYPKYFDEYIKAKSNKQSERKQKEEIEKKIQMRERGCETVSYWKKKKEQQKRKISSK